MSIFHKPFFYYKQHGFTLIEVLVVILIGVLVTLFSVPAYKKMQDRNAYMEASAIVMDLANGIKLTEEECRKEDSDEPFIILRPITQEWATAQAASADSCPSPAQWANSIGWLRERHYINNFPPLDEDNTYKGYSFGINSPGWGSACEKIAGGSNVPSACHGSNAGGAIACAYNSTLDKCIWVDFSGILHNN